MRLVPFALVVFGTTAILAVVGLLNGLAVTEIAVRVIIALVALQVAYFVWLLVSSAVSGKARTYDGRARSTKAAPKSTSAEASD
ncbi:MAG: hypothetical protein AAGA87_04385 [Pseudomonadota bacterium]